MKKSIRVALADDHMVVRRGIANLLNKEAGVKMVLDVSNGSELLAELKNQEVDVVLLDINMPVMNGKQTLHALRLHYPDVKVIMLSMFDEQAIIDEYVSLGASGFLAKNCSIDETVDTIFNVYYEGKQHLIESFKTEMMGASYARIELDERESIVLQLICKGKTSDDIADQISRSKKTVDLIRTRLMQKFEATNVIDLVRKSILLGYFISNEE